MSGTAIQDQGPRISATSYIMLVLATIAVILRFWGSYVGRKAGFWWDDWASLAALVG